MPFTKGHKINVGKHWKWKVRNKPKKGKDVKCLSCDKIFYVFPHRVKDAKYCSTKCNPNLFKEGHEPTKGAFKKGKDNPNWKTGEHVNYYRRTIRKPLHPRANKRGYIPNYVNNMEKHIGRQLKQGEVVHHINKIKNDDRIENLMLFPNNSAHMKFHANQRKLIKI